MSGAVSPFFLVPSQCVYELLHSCTAHTMPTHNFRRSYNFTDLTFVQQWKPSRSKSALVDVQQTSSDLFCARIILVRQTGSSDAVVLGFCFE